MGFYKVIAQTKRRGSSIRDIPLYIAAKSTVDAMDRARSSPRVEKVLSAKPIVAERDYVIGLLTTAYMGYVYHTKDETIHELSKIITSVKHVDHFTTIEGKTLKGFCDRYLAADDEDLKSCINEEFSVWANNQLNNTDNFNR